MTIQNKIKNVIPEPRKRIPAICAASLLAFTLLFFGPSYLYYGNIQEIPFYFSDMVWLFLAYSLVAGLLISTILLFLKGTIHERAVVFIFTIGLLFWIQGHILVWDYGLLDGKVIIWEDYLLNGVIDSVIWLGAIAIALIKGRLFYKYISLMCILLLVIQGVGLASEMYQSPDEPEWKSNSLEYDDKTMFEFSSNQNVIILVLDMFQSDLFQEIIDEDPEYRKIFDGFTYYRNAVGTHPTTYPSVTGILTGEHYDNSIPVQEHIKNSFKNNSIPKVLIENGYQVDLYPLIPKTIYVADTTASNIGANQRGKEMRGAIELVRLTLFRFVPHFLKEKLYFLPFMVMGDNGNLHKDVEFYNSLLSNTSVINGKNIMKYYHLTGVHYPFTLNSKLEGDSLPQNRSGSKEQAKASLKISGELIAQLKGHDIYDNSLIFIVGDHGNPGLIDLNSSSMGQCGMCDYHLFDRKVLTTGIPLILVKPFNTEGDLKISDAPVKLGDIPRSIASELNLSNEFPGESILNINESDKRERNYFFYAWDGEWDNEYLPQIHEYKINGHSWCFESWEPSYMVYNSGEEPFLSLPNLSYEFGNKLYFGKNGTSQQYQLDGWSFPEDGYTWTDGHKAVLGIQTNNTDSELNLSVVAIPFLGEGALDHQQVIVKVNGYLVGEWLFDKPGTQEKSIIIPHGLLDEETQYLAFELPNATSGNDLGITEGNRKLGVAFLSLALVDPSRLNNHNSKNIFPILFGKNGTSQQYQLDGWSFPEDGFTWTDGYTAGLEIQTNNSDSDLNLSVLALPFRGEGALEQQQVIVKMNDHRVGEWLFDQPIPQEKSITIPYGLLDEEIQHIVFELPNATSPRELMLSEDERKLGFAVFSLSLIE